MEPERLNEREERARIENRVQCNQHRKRVDEMNLCMRVRAHSHAANNNQCASAGIGTLLKYTAFMHLNIMSKQQ